MSKSKRDRFKKEDDGMGGDDADDLKQLQDAFGPGEDEIPEPAKEREDEHIDPDLREFEDIIPRRKQRTFGGKNSTRATAPEDFDGDAKHRDNYLYEDGETDPIYEKGE